MLSNIEEAKAMTNAERATMLAELLKALDVGHAVRPKAWFRGMEELVSAISSALDEAEARAYERATKELAAKESEISREAYERAIEDAAKAADNYDLSLTHGVNKCCDKTAANIVTDILALKSPPEKGQP